MNNPAEEIVSTWIQLCKKQFVMTNIPYQYKTKSGKSTTREIDVLATDGQNAFADYEVKWRTTSWINATESETIDAVAEQLSNTERNRAISEVTKKLTGAKVPQIKKILITPMKYFGRESLDQRVKDLSKAGIEIVWFETVLDDLIRHIDDSPDKGQFYSTALGAISIFQELQSELESRTKRG